MSATLVAFPGATGAPDDERWCPVFDVYCSSCAKRRLVFPGQVRAVANDRDGIHVTYVCWCGATGVWTTGRGAGSAASAGSAGSTSPEPLLRAG